MRNSTLLAGIAAGLIAAPQLLFAQSTEDSSVTKQLTTKDGVSLGVTYYPSDAGRQATPVVMLHDHKESRAVYDSFAQRLQKPGKGDKHDSFAVLTVDLRGHGDSSTQRLPGGKRQIEASRLRKQDYEAMVLGDMEAVRKFLVGENDAGALNLNRLSIIGAGMGASVATNWAARDWSMPPLATVKQGQDVKALVLVSPRWKANGLSMQAPLRQQGLRSEVATLLLYGGKGRKHAADARRIYKQLEKYHDLPETPEQDTLPTILKFGPETELQGSEWLKQAGRKAEDLMIRFLTQFAAEPEFERSKRRND